MYIDVEIFMVHKMQLLLILCMYMCIYKYYFIIMVTARIYYNTHTRAHTELFIYSDH